jgi:tRNA A37 threonylcarbamoyladenosine dehydratase
MVPCDDEPNKKTTLGTISYMPPLFGCFMASVVVRGLIEKEAD